MQAMSLQSSPTKRSHNPPSLYNHQLLEKQAGISGRSYIDLQANSNRCQRCKDLIANSRQCCCFQTCPL